MLDMPHPACPPDVPFTQCSPRPILQHTAMERVLMEARGMRPDATISDPALPDRRRTLLRHVTEAALLVGLFAAMAVCLAAGPWLTSLLLR